MSTPFFNPDDLPEDSVQVSQLTISRFLSPSGDDIIMITSADSEGNLLPVIEALGMLELAKHDVLNPPEDELGD